jgi:hypothetical protein
VIVYAIDPGLASGVALLNVPDDGEIEKMGSWEMEPYETMSNTELVIKRYKDWDLRVVVERFTITAETGKKSQAPFSLEIIGAIKYICRVNEMPEPVLQMPVDAKNFAPNPRLKALDLWHRGGHGHALDALRHGLLYAVKNGYRDKRLIAS